MNPSFKIKEKNVLYQKMGQYWYALTEDENGEIIFSRLPKDKDPRKDKICLVEVLKDKEVNKEQLTSNERELLFKKIQEFNSDEPEDETEKEKAKERPLPNKRSPESVA